MCQLGFTGSNYVDDIEECLEVPYNNNGTCTEAYGSFDCQCAQGFGGQLCEQSIGTDSDEENNVTPLAIGLSATLVLIAIILVIIIIVAWRRFHSRKYRGVYSPREAEIASGHEAYTEIDNEGNTERLI